MQVITPWHKFLLKKTNVHQKTLAYFRYFAILLVWVAKRTYTKTKTPLLLVGNNTNPSFLLSNTATIIL